MKSNKKTIIILVSLFIVVFLTFYFIFSNIFIFHRMAGTSMLPTLKPYDGVFYMKKSFYNVGDIIVYKSNQGERVVHRIIEIKEKRYITQGDNNPIWDWTQNVTIEKIEGKVVFVIPFSRLKIRM